MDPIQAAETLRLIAEGIDRTQKPSRFHVSSDIQMVLSALESDDPNVRVAIFGKLKELKRKVLNTKGERKILDKIDRIKLLKKKIPKFIKMIRNGEDFSDLSNDEHFVAAISLMTDISGGSEKLNELSGVRDPSEIEVILGELHEYYEDEGEDDEMGDRKALIKSFSSFDRTCEKRIKELDSKLKGQQSEQKKGKQLDPGKSKKKKEEPEEEVDVDLSEILVLSVYFNVHDVTQCRKYI